MSIVRWRLDTQGLPKIIPTIKYNSPNANETIYSVTMEYDGSVFKHFMMFTPQDKVAVLPAPPQSLPNKMQNNSEGYYNVYSYNYWVFLVNQMLSECFTGLAAQIGLPTAHPPYMTYDPTSKLCLMNLDEAGFSSTATNTPIKIYFNTPLGNLFSSFPFEITSYKADQGMNFRLNPNLVSNSSYPSDTTPSYTVLQVVQEFSTTTNWSPVMSIVVNSNSLGVVGNIDGVPAIQLNGALLNGTGNNAAVSNLITDFVADNYDASIIYNPTSEYRRLELIGTRPLTTLDLSISWKDRMGIVHPFLLASGATATMKILFEKKK